MSESQPTYVTCKGGLQLNKSKFELLNNPGTAIMLRNYEVATAGGYRRINGFIKWGDPSATQPSTTDDILGLHQYALGLVAVAGDGVYYSEDGVTWLQINKDTSHSGSDETQLGIDAALPRTGQGQAQMLVVKGTVAHADNPYGVLYIGTEGDDPVAHFHIDGTGVGRTFHYTELSTPAAGQYIENHHKHLCVVDIENAPSTVYYSATNDFDDFAGTGSGSITLADHVVGLKSFRDTLYIFCQNSIHKLTNINDASNISVDPVTNNLGCLSGYTIQEVGGDIVFLAPDGLRTIAGTERISDVELSSVSKDIQPLMEEISASVSAYTMNSLVIREKSQYRMYYLTTAGVGHGLCGTLRPQEDGSVKFEWSELRNIPVSACVGWFDENGEESLFHGSPDGYVYQHDTGSDFDGSDILAIYRTPDTHFGDLGLRKTLHYVNLAVDNEGIAEFYLAVKFDYNNRTTTMQPPPYLIQLGTNTVYGTAIWDTDVYSGSDKAPMTRVPLQGSGHSVSYTFYSDNALQPWTIQGFHTELMPSGRK